MAIASPSGTCAKVLVVSAGPGVRVWSASIPTECVTPEITELLDNIDARRPGWREDGIDLLDRVQNTWSDSGKPFCTSDSDGDDTDSTVSVDMSGVEIHSVPCPLLVTRICLMIEYDIFG